MYINAAVGSHIDIYKHLSGVSDNSPLFINVQFGALVKEIRAIVVIQVISTKSLWNSPIQNTESP